MSDSELKTKKIKCRCAHPCEWCNEWVQKGEEAIYRSYVWEGEFNSAWQHLECFDAMEKSSGEIQYEGFEQGTLDRGKTFAESSGNH